jgi:hypothetical protein
MTYFLFFRDILQIEPEFPLLMLFRTPLTPVFYGMCFEFLDVGSSRASWREFMAIPMV